MWHMRKSATKGNKKKACEKLLAEYNRLKDRKDLKVLSKIKDHTFENTCPLLANYYKVSPIFHLHHYVYSGMPQKTLSHLQFCFYQGQHRYPLNGQYRL